MARAVVRTLLRRAVKTHLIVWWWKEAAGKSKYAKPDVAGFEHDMEAPVFSDGTLGVKLRREEADDDDDAPPPPPAKKTRA